MMKNLKEFILEKFKINSKNVKSQNEEYNKDNYKEALEILKNEASKYDCKIIFKSHLGGNNGDFTIFIYTSENYKKYAVEFDGSWDSEYDVSFDHCYHKILDWLKEKYNK